MFLISYSMIGGFGLGINLFLPIYISWKCFPLTKGAVTSAIFCSEAIGTIIFSLSSSQLVNPANSQATIVSIVGNTHYNYFALDVANNIPWMFRYFACFTLVIMTIAILFIWLPPYNLE